VVRSRPGFVTTRCNTRHEIDIQPNREGCEAIELEKVFHNASTRQSIQNVCKTLRIVSPIVRPNLRRDRFEIEIDARNQAG
jgi:hypothetical protein